MIVSHVIVLWYIWCDISCTNRVPKFLWCLLWRSENG